MQQGWRLEIFTCRMPLALGKVSSLSDSDGFNCSHANSEDDVRGSLDREVISNVMMLEEFDEHVLGLFGYGVLAWKTVKYDSVRKRQNKVHLGAYGRKVLLQMRRRLLSSRHGTTGRKTSHLPKPRLELPL